MWSFPRFARASVHGLVSVLVAAALVAADGGSMAVPASAGTVIPAVPQSDAADWTPQVVDDESVPDAGVYQLREVGATMYVGGDFNRVEDAHGGASYDRTHLFSFDRSTGQVSLWAPELNGPVWAIEPSADGNSLYIGGQFTRFDGRYVHRLVKYDLVHGAVDESFVFPTPIRRVTDLELVNGRLVVSGIFAGGIVGVDPVTGTPDSFFDRTRAAGQEDGYSTRIYRFAVNPKGTRMVVIGSFTSIGKRARQQAAMLAIGGGAAKVSRWKSKRWNRDCHAELRHYTRDVDWSPNGKRFAIVTTGAPTVKRAELCDTVTWWRYRNRPRQQPVWINRSGGDTFHSVAVTDQAVFVSGHFRWLDNPEGRDFAGPGAVERRGLGAIDPRTGEATDWNPTKSLEGGRGGYDLYFASDGLWLGHFEQYLTGERHQGLGLLPY